MEIAGFILKSPRRPIYRPTFDVLERRILPTIALVTYPLPSPDGDLFGTTFPSSLATGDDGSLWFLEGGEEVERIGADGTIATISLPTPNTPDPYSGSDEFERLTVGPDGDAWADGPREIAEVTPGGLLTTFALDNPESQPYSAYLAPTSITFGPDGALWFLATSRSIGRMTTDGVVTDYPLPDNSDFDLASPDETESANHITAGPDGALWFTAGTNVGRITTDGEIELFPSTLGDLGDITLGPDGNLWFAPYQGPWIGRITPEGQQATFTLPTTWATPSSLEASPDGGIAFIEQQDGKIGRISTDGVIDESSLFDTGMDYPDYSPVQLAFAPDGTLFYSMFHDVGLPNPNLGGGYPNFGTMTHEIDQVDSSNFVPVDAQPASASIASGPVFAGTVATFQPINPIEPAGDFSSSIDWGDGSTSTGLVIPSGSGSYQVEGLHVFEGAGPFTVTVTVTITAQPTDSSFPIVLPSVVQETVTVTDSPVLPIPGPGAGADDSSSPPVLIMLPETSISAVVPIAALPIFAPITPSNPITPSIVEPDRPKATVPAAVSNSSTNPTAVVPLVPLDPTPASSAVGPGSGTVAALATGASTTSRPSSRVVKPVPTLGLASPKLASVRRSASPAPNPLRVARASLPNLEVDVHSTPEASQGVVAP